MLCQISVVEDDSVINAAYKSVITQLKEVGIHNIPLTIPIKLVNLIELNKRFSRKTHGNLKGFTKKEHNQTFKLSYTGY